MELSEKKVILLNPPFFRFCGSHNDKAPLSLCYLSEILHQNHIDHVVYNADYTGANSYWSFKKLFDEFDTFKQAVDNNGSLYGEVIEKLMGLNPDAVVIMGADPLIPTKDWGSPYIAANFSKRLKALGLYTIGLGPYFTMNSEKFISSFDCILAGEPSNQILEILKTRPTGLVDRRPLSTEIIPNFDYLYPEKQRTDIMMTSFGCLYPCSFCVAGKMYRSFKTPVRFADIETIIKDVKRRKEKKIYLEDLNFANYSTKQLHKLVESFQKHEIKKNFVAECSINGVTEERLQLYKKIGINTLKLGIEGLTDSMLKNFKKSQTIDKIKSAVELIHRNEMEYVAYLLIGGDNTQVDYQKTLEFIKDLKPNYVVVSIMAYDLNDDYTYDTQFSPVSLNRWNLPKEIFYRYLELQNEVNPTLGRIIHG